MHFVKRHCLTLSGGTRGPSVIPTLHKIGNPDEAALVDPGVEKVARAVLDLNTETGHGPCAEIGLLGLIRRLVAMTPATHKEN